MDGGDLDVTRAKLRMDGFNASWSKLTSSQVLGLCSRESSANMALTHETLPGWPICKGADGPGTTPEATGGPGGKVPETWEGFGWMLPGAAM